MVEKTKPEKGYITFFSKKTGLKIVIKPEKRWRDSNGNPKKEKGIYVKFENGRFRTDDKNIIEFIREEHGKRFPGEITEVDETKIIREKEIRERVIAEMKKEGMTEGEELPQAKIETITKKEKLKEAVKNK